MAATQTPAPSRPAENTGSRIPRFLLILAGFAFAWLAIDGLRQLSGMIAPVFLALNLVIVAYPIKAAMTRRGLPEWLGAIVSTLVVFVILILFFVSIGWAIASLVDALPNYNDQFNKLYQDALHTLSKFGVNEQQVNEQLQGIDSSSIMSWVSRAASMFSGAFSLLAVVVTMLFFLAMDSIGFGNRMTIAGRHHAPLAGALVQFAHGVRKYWVVSTVFGLIVAVLDWGLLAAVGVPLAMVWAVLSFVTNYIPNVGFVFGLVPPALMALLDGGPVHAIIVVAGYCVLNFVVQSLIQPKVAGDAVGVTASLSFFSLLFWSWVLGPLGSILALPATLLVKAMLVDADPHTRWINSFIASTPETAEPKKRGARAV